MATKPFRVMLAETCDDPALLKYPVLVSPKLDGIRCVIRDGVPKTRMGLDLPNRFLQQKFAGLPSFDGELMMKGEDGKWLPFDQVQSAVMRHEGEPNVEFMVFDAPDCPGGFKDRFSFVVNRHGMYGLGIVPHYEVVNVLDFTSWEQLFVDAGYEGLMVRAPDGLYKQGRSTLKQGWLLKVKRWHDVEALIIGAVEQMHNANEKEVNELGLTKRSKKKAGMVPMGMLGAWKCVDAVGHEFEVGSGFTKEQRLEFWRERSAYIGTEFVTVKFFERTKDGAPRFPIFLHVRDKRDMS